MKRFIATALILALLVPFSPAVAADESHAVPTVEEILNEYHQKAFEQQMQENDDTASAWSRRGGASNTLEEETVDTLNAAGYEAYHVTAANYDALEEDLNTNFADMGLDPEGSYIIVISGDDAQEDPSDNNGPASRAKPDFELEGPPGSSDRSFSYTYNGKTYTMRYITITAANNSSLGQTSAVDLLQRADADDIFDLLSFPLTVLSTIPNYSVSTTLLSLIQSALPDINQPQPASFMYRAASNWTIEYVQIYSPADSEWRSCSSVEYVNLRYFINYTYYASSTNQYEQVSCNGTHGSVYSSYYYNYEVQKERAVIAYEGSIEGCLRDKVNEIRYIINDEAVIVHLRSIAMDNLS